MPFLPFFYPIRGPYIFFAGKVIKSATAVSFPDAANIWSAYDIGLFFSICFPAAQTGNELGRCFRRHSGSSKEASRKNSLKLVAVDCMIRTMCNCVV